MSIGDWFKSLFGKGVIHMAGMTSNGQTFKATAPYIGDVNTLDEEELFDSINRDMIRDHGLTVIRHSFRITRIERK